MKDLDSMEKTVSSQDATNRFGDLLQQVTDKGDRYVVEQDGVPLTAVVPFALYSQRKGRREDFFGQMRETADRVGLTEREASRIADAAKRAVRSQP